MTAPSPAVVGICSFVIFGVVFAVYWIVLHLLIDNNCSRLLKRLCPCARDENNVMPESDERSTELFNISRGVQEVWANEPPSYSNFNESSRTRTSYNWTVEIEDDESSPKISRMTDSEKEDEVPPAYGDVMNSLQTYSTVLASDPSNGMDENNSSS